MSASKTKNVKGRNLDILKLYASRLSYYAIGKRHGIDPKTVEEIIQNAVRKLVEEIPAR